MLELKIVALKDSEIDLLVEMTREKMFEVLHESRVNTEMGTQRLAKEMERLSSILSSLADPFFFKEGAPVCTQDPEPEAAPEPKPTPEDPEPMETLDPMPEPEPDPEPEPTPEPEKVEDPEDDLPSEPRTCKDCEHCIDRSGKGRGMQYKCGLSDAWFGRNLGCDAFRRKKQ